MFETLDIKKTDGGIDYDLMLKQAGALIEGETDLIANLSNISALLNVLLSDINWVGFYLLDRTGDELVLGPFQGRPACVRIAPGRGVCGTAWSSRISQLVDDVNAFPGHIACDAASASELVVPVVTGAHCPAVIDIDSPSKRRFGEADQRGIEALADLLAAELDWGGYAG